MRPTEVLSAEHRVIEVVLDCLEALATRARGEGRLDVLRVAQVLEVLRTFADRCHHGKEEGLLFPMLTARGLPREVGPVAVMLDEHRTGRDFIAQMGQASEQADVTRFCSAAAGYVQLLREHIAKEDGVLFPLAEAMLDDEARRVLLASFQAVEHDDLGPGTHERMLALVEGLAEHFGVPQTALRTSAGAHTGCMGHASGCH